MEYVIYTFNSIEILLIKVDFPLSVHRPTAIRQQFGFTIDTPPRELHHTIIQSILSIEPSCKAIIYSQQIEYLHSFEGGLKIDLTMSVAIAYRQNAFEHSIDVLFWEELRPLLVGRMHEPFIDVYLSSLRESIIKRDNLSEKLMWKHGLNGDNDCSEAGLLNLHINTRCTDGDLFSNLKHYITELTDEKINIISKVILNNELTYAVSSNVFNLHKAEPQQQNSLNVKHTNIIFGNNGDSNDNKNYKYIHSLYLENIQSGVTYVTLPDDLVFINIRINYCKFMEFVARNYFFCFKINVNILAFVQATVGLKRESFQDFRQININHKLIQFQVVDKDDETISTLDLTQIKFAETPCLGIWQSGDAKLLKIMSFSEETLNSNAKTFDIYAIVCIDFMEKLLIHTRCSVKIRRVVVFDDFKFYYALFCVNIQHVAVLSTLLVEYQQKCCTYAPAARNPANLLDVLWGQRKCCSLIYHTHFKWINDALYVKKNEEHVHMLTEAAAMNLIHYKYIHETKNLDTIPRTADDAETFAQILIETKRNIYRDIVDPTIAGSVKSKKIKFSPFDGIKDGPMVAAVSVRTCEKLTNNQVLDKEWPVNVTNVTMLLNTPDYRGVQNPANVLKF